jgi:hypothetical protein
MGSDLPARHRDAKDILPTWMVKLNDQWAHAEERLRSLALPDPVWVAVKQETIKPDDPRKEDDPAYERDIDHSLGYTKVEGQWRICYCVFDTSDHPDSADVRPISECSMQQRIDAAHALPKLFEEAVKAVERKAEEVEAAVGAIAEALAPFKRPNK